MTGKEAARLADTVAMLSTMLCGCKVEWEFRMDRSGERLELHHEDGCEWLATLDGKR